MTQAEFDILRYDLAARLVEENIAAAPAAFAANKAIARLIAQEFGPGSRAQSIIATQIKYLQRARTKLPHYYQARCIIPPLAFEQCSNEECAAHKRYRGGECIDLTCGLGVDSANFARNFRHVISIEADPVLAGIARHNFARLGLDNIKVINATAEDFLSNPDLRANLVYADPDRRSTDNRKLVLLEDCTPNVIALHARLHEISERVVVKCSPLFDPAEAFRLFGRHTLAEAVSLQGECKEVLIETGSHITQPAVRASVAGGASAEWPLESPPAMSAQDFTPPYKYLIIPDVALRKMRMSKAYFLSRGAFIATDNGYAFGDEPPGEGFCRLLAIEEILPYSPKMLKTLLKKKGISRLQIMQRDFPMTNGTIAKQLSVKEGGGAMAAFTVVDGKQLAVLLSNVNR